MTTIPDLFGGEPLPEVAFEFASSGDPDAHWRVSHGRVSEGISEVYEASLDLVNSDVFADPTRMVNQTCSFAMRRADHTRYLRGLVRRVEEMGTLGGRRLARVIIVPALWALSQRVNNRVFQNVTSVDVAKEIFRGAGIYQGAAYDDAGVQATLPTREYCVQYRESELHFVMRLLEEDGVAFTFDHRSASEKIVLFTGTGSLRAVPTMDGGEVIAITGPEGATARYETIRSFDWFSEVRPTGYVARDFDFTRPAYTLQGSEPSSTGAREVFDHPARVVVSDYQEGDHSYHADDSGDLALLRHHEQAGTARHGRGTSNVTAMYPAGRFTLGNHSRDDYDVAYIATHVEHTLHAPEVTTADATPQGLDLDRYHNSFRAVRAADPYAPPRRTPRPMAHGPETAVVVGDANEEITTDFHGRIKVQFFWDRRGQSNTHSSCWVRVSQTWAGPGWGSLFIPRHGMEVVVNFLQGDPDRPLVTGCVYNGANHPPYTLPDEKTRSTIKSNSTLGGHGFNELRFEDLKNREEVFLHAQRNLTEIVRNCHSTSVGADQSNSVGGNQTESVDKDQKLTVKKNRVKHVMLHEDITVDNGRVTVINTSDSLQVNGPQETEINGDQSYTVTGNQTVSVGINRDTTVHANDTLTVTTQLLMQQAGTKITLGGNTATVESPTQIQLKVGGSMITMTPSDITIEATGQITVKTGAAQMVLVPGIGKGVNGARRWIGLGFMSFQPSELAKFAVLVYAADYMVRKMDVKERFFRAVLPMAVAVAVVGMLLLAEPDMGAFMVIAVIAMGILFLGGVNARMFFLIAAVIVVAFGMMIAFSEWRRERIFAYLDPWSEKHALGKGYQLSHSLIAIGRGEIFGVGLGGSVEKLHWLPEAHTDFLLAVIGEEFGLVGVVTVIGLFFWMTRRVMHIGRQAIALDRVFAGLVAQGVGIWIGFQAFINMGVNLGALPTKGLTLPLMSYGGSAILMNLVALAVVLRIDYENRTLMRGGRP